MQDRRYSEEDVQRILALAAEAETTALASGERQWTLAEIQRAGAEAGIAPASVAAAAVALDSQAAAPGDRRYLGLPVAVSRAVPLARPLSDEDWGRLVAQLRDTFAAQGRIEVTGGRREWRNGNLRVSHEPTDAGAVLALRTRKGDAPAMFALAGTMLLVAIAIGVASLLGADGERATRAMLAGVLGAVILVVGALRLPFWAGARGRQFDAIAGFARRLTGS